MPRPAKSSHLKAVSGTLRRDRRKTTRTPVAGAPLCPSHLSPAAKREWRRVTHLLTSAGMLSRLDLGVLAGYCQNYARWLEAEAQLATEKLVFVSPGGISRPNPLIAIASKAYEAVLQGARELGLTPNARQKLAVHEPEPESPLDHFLSKGGKPHAA